MILCPECALGKHGNCDGTAFDRAADALVPCPCAHETGLVQGVHVPACNAGCYGDSHYLQAGP